MSARLVEVCGQGWQFPGAFDGTTGTFKEYVFQLFGPGESEDTPIQVFLNTVSVFAPRPPSGPGPAIVNLGPDHLLTMLCQRPTA